MIRNLHYFVSVVIVITWTKWGGTQREIHTAGAATNFLEWFYCKYTCILTAHWQGSPSNYSPWAAINLPQWCCHCSKLLLWRSFHCCR